MVSRFFADDGLILGHSVEEARDNIKTLIEAGKDIWTGNKQRKKQLYNIQYG